MMVWKFFLQLQTWCYFGFVFLFDGFSLVCCLIISAVLHLQFFGAFGLHSLHIPTPHWFFLLKKAGSEFSWIKDRSKTGGCQPNSCLLREEFIPAVPLQTKRWLEFLAAMLGVPWANSIRVVMDVPQGSNPSNQYLDLFKVIFCFFRW